MCSRKSSFTAKVLLHNPQFRTHAAELTRWCSSRSHFCWKDKPQTQHSISDEICELSLALIPTKHERWEKHLSSSVSFILEEHGVCCNVADDVKGESWHLQDKLCSHYYCHSTCPQCPFQQSTHSRFLPSLSDRVMITEYDIMHKIFSLRWWFWITTNQSVLQNQEQKYLQNYICKDIANDRCNSNFISCLNIECYKVCLKIDIFAKHFV